MTTLGSHWFKSRQRYLSSINSMILDVFRMNVLSLRMILFAFTKVFSKITANVTMGRTLECANVTTLGQRISDVCKLKSLQPGNTVLRTRLIEFRSGN